MKRKLTIGTRKSALALWQAEYIKKALEGYDPELTVTLEHIVTKGDKILDVPLARIGGKGLFTTELESRLLAGTIDLAVHSLKDLPADLPDGLCLAAVTARSHVHDVFVSNRYAALDALPQGACVGTSSLRRRAQLLARRPDLTVRDLRGNVDTRLKKLDDGEYDAIILAEAGLTRLGLTDRITQLLPTDTMIPAVGQGALAIETRADDDDLKQAPFLSLRPKKRRPPRRRNAPFSSHQRQLSGPRRRLRQGQRRAALPCPASSPPRRQPRLPPSGDGPCSDSRSLGQQAAKTLLDEGGRQILTDLGITPAE